MNGTALRDARLNQRLTLIELSQKSGVDHRTISDLEHGRIQSPSYDKVVKLAHALGLEPSDLWPVDLPPQPDDAQVVNS